MESTFDSCFQLAVTQNQIDNDLYRLYNVKKGLRNEDGTGVRIGLTRIADVVGYEYKDGVKTPCEGKLIYRGYEIRSLVENKAHMGFEETCFLLLFGWLPIASSASRPTSRFSAWPLLPSVYTGGCSTSRIVPASSEDGVALSGAAVRFVFPAVRASNRVCCKSQQAL